MRLFGAALSAVLLACAPAHAEAQTPPPKFQIEARFMAWADSAQRQSLPTQRDTIHDFFLRRARVIAQGRPSESLTLYFQVGQDNVGSKILGDDGGLRIKDAYVNYRAADALQIVVGQFKIPFLRANLESGFNQLLVDRGNLPTLRPAREGSRDLGAMAWGNINALQYRVALFDGTDQERTNPESSVRLSTRAAYNWFTKETGLGYTGTYLGTSRVLQVAAQVDLQNARVDSRDDSALQASARDYRAYAIEAFFEQPLGRHSAVTVDGALVRRDDDYVEIGVPTRQVRGYYVQPGVLLPGAPGGGRVQVTFRRESWETQRGAADLNTSRTTLGATYFLKAHDRKLQADFTRKRETPSISNDEFRLSIVVVF